MTALVMAGGKKAAEDPTPASIFGANLALNLLLANFNATTDVWSDDSGNGNDASDVAVSGFTKDADGVIFDGAGNRLEIADDASLDGGGALATLVVGLVMKPDVASGNNVPISKSTTGAGSWSTQTNATAFRFHCGAPGSAFGETAGVIGAGTAVRVIWRYDGGGTGNAGRLRCYVDGVEGSPSYTGTIPATLSNTTNKVLIGAYEGGAQLWDGRIKHVLMAVGHTTSDQDITDLDAYLATL